MDNKKLIWIVVGAIVVVVLALLAFSGGDKKEQSDKQTITIGATLPLSGGLAFLGDAYKQAMLMALSEVQAKTDLKYNYAIIFEDDKFEPATAASTANKLVSVDKVDALASFGSPVGNVVSPIAEKSGIIHINGIASDPTVAQGDYNFVHWTPPYEEAKLMIAEMQKRGIKNVVLFEQNQPGVLAVVNAFKDGLVGSEIKITSDQKFNTGETDFRSLISKAKTSAADIYLLEATSPELEILAKQIREMGIKTPFTSVESFEFTDNPQLFEGEWYVNAADQSQEFIDVFTKAYSNPPKLGSGNGYDVVNLLVSAFENAGTGESKPEQGEVLKALSGIKDFKGAMGNLSIDSSGIVVTPAVLRTIKDGKAMTVK